MNLALPQHGLDLSFQWLCRTSWEASLLIVLTGVAQLGFRRVGMARGCHVLNLLVLVRLLLPVSPASSLSLFNLLPESPSVLFRKPFEHASGGTFRHADVLRSPELPRVGPFAEANLSRDEGRVNENANPVRLDPPSLQSELVPFRDSPRPVKRVLALAEFIWIAVAGALLMRAFRQHGRFLRWVRVQEPVRDERVLAELDKARRLMRIAQPIRLLATDCGTSPALFGWWKPCLLVPKSSLHRLELGELKFVFLHELAHVRQRDIPLNWAMIMARALHWFNPLVWWALHRLRVNRELVCDAMALGVVAKEEHRHYGHVLLKLVEQFSATPHAPSLVPVVNHQHEIQRRIAMILRFKTLGPASLALLTVATISLALLTLTRAADPVRDSGEPGQGLVRAPQQTSAARSLALAAPEPVREQSRATFSELKGALSQLDSRIRAQKEVVDRYRAKAAGLDSSPSMTPETIRDLEHERISAEARVAQYQMLSDSLGTLKNKDSLELAEAVPTVVPDQELVRLLSDLHQAEQGVAKLEVEYGEGSPQMMALRRSVRVVRDQIVRRIEGIMRGLNAQVQAQKATADSLSDQVNRMKAKDAELTEKYRPYFEAKRNLDLLEKIRDSLVVQIVMKQVGHQDQLDIPGLPESSETAAPR